MGLVLLGTVVTFDPERPVITDGAVFVGDHGEIEAIGPRLRQRQPSGYRESPRVDTGGVIYPGLVDLHSHLAYNWLRLWEPPSPVPYIDRDQWRADSTYIREIQRPAEIMGAQAAKAVLKFAEVKALVGGTTTIQGAPRLTQPYSGWIVRLVDDETWGTGRRRVWSSVFTLDAAGRAQARADLARGDDFIYHLAEGTDPRLQADFDALAADGCLLRGLVGIHATALDADRFARWSGHDGTVVWSPTSEIWLYRGTTDVVAAHKSGLRVCLGSDWSPSGTKHLLAELKVAELWNRTQLDRRFSDFDLCRMVTSQPAEALEPAWGDRIGRIRPGLAADLLITSRRRSDVYRNLIRATEASVGLVLVGGRPVYGTRGLMGLARAHRPEPIRVGRSVRSISLTNPAIPDADMTWTQVLAALRTARNTAAALPDRAQPLEEDDGRLRLIPDVPPVSGPDQAAADQASAVGPTVLPPLDSLTHDEAFFRRLSTAPIPRGLLDGLRSYYR